MSSLRTAIVLISMITFPGFALGDGAPTSSSKTERYAGIDPIKNDPKTYERHKCCNKVYPREMVRIRTGGSLNSGSSRSSEVIMTVPADKVLVIETISADIRIPDIAPAPEVSRLVIVTGSAFPPGTGSPLIDIPLTRMAVDPAGSFRNYVAVENMRAYATDGVVQYSIDLSAPSSGSFDVSLFGYLLPIDSPSLAP